MQLSNEMTNALSAEAALGTLRGPAAKRWQQLSAADSKLIAQVASWDQLLAPMASWLPETPVPAGVWDGIEQVLFAAPVALPARRPTNARWIGAAIAMAASLGLWLALPSAPTTISTPALQLKTLATLSSEHQLARWQISQRSDGQVSVSVNVAWQQPANRSLQLWAIDTEGTPHSLGIITLVEQSSTLNLSSTQREQLRRVTVFAISDEPLGGSRNALPSGPVIFSGKASKS